MRQRQTVDGVRNQKSAGLGQINFTSIISRTPLYSLSASTREDMATIKVNGEGSRTTRQSTTRTYGSTRTHVVVQEGVREDIHPSPESRSRRKSSSPISSLSPSPQKAAYSLPPSASIAIPAPIPKGTRASRDKGKGKAIEPPFAGQGEQARAGKRVLPARIRRAAGGGQEGFRDLEDIIVDWLDRYGTLLHLTTRE
jgi:hypothetical protein